MAEMNEKAEIKLPNFEWSMHCGGLLVGYVHLQDTDFPWYNCLLDAMPEFEAYRHIFDAEIQAMQDDYDDEWDRCRERIETLKITLIALNPATPQLEEAGILHIDGTNVWFRPIFAEDDDETENE